MRKILIFAAVVVLSALCFSGWLTRIDIQASALGWGALACLVVGGVWGARYARVRRAYADWQGYRRAVRTSRRGLVQHSLSLLRWGALLAVVVWLASLGLR